MRSAALIKLDQRFARVTSSVTFIPQIDGMRALALIFVLMHHVFAIFLEDTHRLGTISLPRDWALITGRSTLVAWALHLRFGIFMFFAISGFVLALPLCRDIQAGLPFPSIRLFLLRRLIRMEPPYVFCMTLFFFLILAPWTTYAYSHIMFKIFLPHYLASWLYLHALLYKTPSWINGVAWTLEVEVQFYLLMPILAQLFRIRQAYLRRLVFATSILASALFDQIVLPHLADPRYSLSIVGNLEFFLAGLLLADLYVDQPSFSKLTPGVYDAVATFSIVILVYILHWLPVLAWFMPFVLITFFLGIINGRWYSRLFELKVFTIPGAMCYTAYLYHFVIIKKLMPYTVRLIRPIHALWLDVFGQACMMLLPIAFAVAILYLATERPFVVLSHQVTRRWRSRRTVPSVGV